MKKNIGKGLVSVFAALVLLTVLSVSVFAGTVSSRDAAAIALKKAGLKKSEVTELETEYDAKAGAFEVEFVRKKNKAEYDFSIAKKNGRILKRSVEYKHKPVLSKKKIGKKAAQKAVAAFSGISLKTVQNGSCRFESDRKEGKYEVKFKKGNYRFEYEVLASTGRIAEAEIEWIRK